MKTTRKRIKTRLNGQDCEARPFEPTKSYRDILSKETRERLEAFEKRTMTEHTEVKRG